MRPATVWFVLQLENRAPRSFTTLGSRAVEITCGSKISSPSGVDPSVQLGWEQKA